VRITRLPDVEHRVHLGHRRVIEGADTVLTFDPHPSSVVSPGHAPKLLTSLDVKADLVSSLGVQEMIVIPFDREFAQRSAQRFIDAVLIEALGATHVSVGENFRFGRKAEGDSDMLAAESRFETRVVALIELDGEIVSSSRTRGLVAAGDVAQARRFLGAPLQLRGQVVHGDERGRKLGYPTANLIPPDELVCPAHGVYACRADGRPAAVSIGVRPTFVTGRGELIEAYLIDFEGDLYGATLRLDFLRRLRGERRFDGVEALVAQMGDDVEQARGIAASE